jgi:hypothetical protein
MASKVNSISAKDISSAVAAAVRKSTTLKGIAAAEPSFATIRPPIIGFILREADAKNASITELNKLAANVAGSLGGAGSKSQAATFYHNGHIIMGYVEEATFSVFKE